MGALQKRSENASPLLNVSPKPIKTEKEKEKEKEKEEEKPEARQVFTDPSKEPSEKDNPQKSTQQNEKKEPKPAEKPEQPDTKTTEIKEETAKTFRPEKRSVASVGSHSNIKPVTLPANTKTKAPQPAKQLPLNPSTFFQPQSSSENLTTTPSDPLPHLTPNPIAVNPLNVETEAPPSTPLQNQVVNTSFINEKPLEDKSQLEKEVQPMLAEEFEQYKRNTTAMIENTQNFTREIVNTIAQIENVTHTVLAQIPDSKSAKQTVDELITNINQLQPEKAHEQIEKHLRTMERKINNLRKAYETLRINDTKTTISEIKKIIKTPSEQPLTQSPSKL